MVLFYLFCVLAFAGSYDAFAVEPGVDSCVSCHAELEDEELVAPARLMKQDIHSHQGLSCAGCHGGDDSSDDEDEAMDEEAGFIGVPDKGELPQFCGKCHSDAAFIRQYNPALRVDQVALYRSSLHGQRLIEGGDEKVAACADCHGAHGILPATDPRSTVNAANVPNTCGTCHSDPIYMQDYGIPTDQYEKYRKSVHGRPLLEDGDLSAPACNDCHGNHGAAPPGVKSMANVCGQCHPINNDLVAQSKLSPAFEELGVAACEVCHNHHAIESPNDEMVGTEPPATCVKCHNQGKWPQGLEAARAIRAALDSLVEQHDRAEVLVRRAERAGMEVGEALFELNEAAGRLTKTRSVLHGFDVEEVEKVRDEGLELAAAAAEKGQAALDEQQFRRKGLGLSLIVIVILGGALYMKIRAIDQNS